MNTTPRTLLARFLRSAAVAVLRKYRPTIVAVTGSVGKTSTTAAISAVLRSKFRVGQSVDNYNSEIGLPLSILGVRSGKRSVVGWGKTLHRFLQLIVRTDHAYPQVLVLEMGADAPGDLGYLTSFVPIDVAVITRIAPAHLEQFGTIEMIVKEKSTVAKQVGKRGVVVLNSDDPHQTELAGKLKAQIIKYGLRAGADILASEISLSYDEQTAGPVVQGMSCKVAFGGSTVPVLLPGVAGESMISSALAALAVGQCFGLHLVEMSQALRSWTPPPGRMRILPGVKQTLLIDDSYNSSPYAAQAAVELLRDMNAPRGAKRYAVLGTMLELGAMTEQAHRELGEAVARYKIQHLVTVGNEGQNIIAGAIGAGMSSKNCFHFADAATAGRFVQEQLKPGDIVLIKASRAVHMEVITRELMAEPQRAEELIVRE